MAKLIGLSPTAAVRRGPGLGAFVNPVGMPIAVWHSMRTTLALTTAVAATIAFIALPPLAGSAHAAEATDGALHGHFPLLELAALSGLTGVPVTYALGTSPDSNTATDSVTGGAVGLGAIGHVDMGPLLLELDGVYNFLSSGLRYRGGAHVFFGAGLGARDDLHVVRSISDSPSSSSGYYTRTTTYYTNKFLPALYGVSGGVTVIAVGPVSYDNAFTGIYNRGAATLTAIDAGLSVKSPQIELTAAPAYELTNGNFGLRWVFGMAFPIGNHLFGFRFTGNHFFGGDKPDNSGRPLQVLMLASLYWTTGVGIE